MTYEDVLILLSAICLVASSGVIIFLMYRIFDLLDENKSMTAMVQEYDKNVQIQKNYAEFWRKMYMENR